MDFDLSVLLIVLPFIFVGGFIDAIAGGGGIVGMIGFMLAGVPMHNILGTNKIQAMFGTGVATRNYVKNGSYKKEYIIFSVLGSLCGAFLGSSVALSIEQDTLAIIMTIALPIISLVSLSGFRGEKKETHYSRKKIYLLALSIGLGVGFYDGLIGPGAGTFYIIAFSLCGMSLLEANGNAKIVNLGSNISAGMWLLINGKVIVWLVIPCIIVNMVSNYLGSKLAINNGDKIVKPVIILVLILLFIKTIYEFL
ncbi:TSUP family transporter [Erysipelotrichaceae bacterium OttesenSCG-928-M19]|nr:TSUP family transporter [Erysipelotrichaceae bacterium OttesenSCG-928-M19]